MTVNGVALNYICIPNLWVFVLDPIDFDQAFVQPLILLRLPFSPMRTPFWMLVL